MPYLTIAPAPVGRMPLDNSVIADNTVADNTTPPPDNSVMADNTVADNTVADNTVADNTVADSTVPVNTPATVLPPDAQSDLNPTPIDDSPTVPLYDNTTGRIVSHPLDSVESAYASGNYLIPLQAPDGSFAAVLPQDASGALANGYTQPDNSVVYARQAQKDALVEAAQHPIQSFAESAAGGLVPGGRKILSEIAPETESLQNQSEREQANPVASTLGNVTGSIGQAVGVGLLTGGLGDLAEGAGLGTKAAEIAAGAATAATQGAVAGITGGMDESDLGNTAYNAQSLAFDAGLGTVLGLGLHSVTLLGEAAIPRVVSAAKNALTSLEDASKAAFATSVARASGNAEVEQLALNAMNEAVPPAGTQPPLPLSKAVKLDMAAETRKNAAELATTIQSTLEKTADLHSDFWNDSRPLEIRQLGKLQDATVVNGINGIQAAQDGVRNLVNNVLKPGIDDIANQELSWTSPIKAATKALTQLQKDIGPFKVNSSSDVYNALLSARQTIDDSLKYGKTLIDPDQRAVAGQLQARVLTPIRNLLGRYEPGTATFTDPNAVTTFGLEQASRNAQVNEAFNKLSTARTNLMSRLGFTDLDTSGRPITEIKPSKVESLIRGEGTAGELPTKLSQTEAKNALDEFVSATKNYTSVMTPTLSGVSQGVNDLADNIVSQRASAQSQLESTAMQKLANATSLTGQGAGGLRGAIRNASGIGAEVFGLATGHPALGAAAWVGTHAYNGIKFPVETIRTYAAIRSAAAKTAAILTSTANKIVDSGLGNLGKNVAINASTQEIVKANNNREDYGKLTTEIDNRNFNPSAFVNMLTENLQHVAPYAPAHSAALVGTALQGHNQLASAIPHNPSPSALGPTYDTWQPSDSDIRNFNQIKNGVLFPKVVLQHAIDGSITAKEWSSFQTTYPALASDLAGQIIKNITNTPKHNFSIAQNRVINLITGLPVSNADPRRIALSQATYNLPESQSKQQTLADGPKLRAKGLDNLGMSSDTALPGQKRELS